MSPKRLDRRALLARACSLGGLAALNGWRLPALRGDCPWQAHLDRDLRPLTPIAEHVMARGRRGMVSSSHPLATEAAVCALEKGGTAADAYLTAAFAQTVLEPPMTTLAGALGITYFESRTGLLHQGGGGFTSPAAETAEWTEADSITGRAVLVPGWVRGAELIHKRFGKLSWADLIEPAIEFAERGFIIDHLLWGWTYEAKNFAGRFPEGQRVWFPNGRMLGVGDRLRQPELATTLKRLRDEGPDYFYTGEWGQKFVAAVRRLGGRVTADDLRSYKSRGFAEPWMPGSGKGLATASYRGYEVGPPSLAMFGLAFNLLEAGDLRARGRPTENADSLYYLMRIMQEIWHTGHLYRPETHDLFVSKEYARQIWRVIESGPPRPFEGFAEGTCGLTVVDSEGNVAGGTHSSSSTAYGTGLFVEGVILNRVIYLRKYKVPSGISTNVWLFKDGKPALTLATPSRAFTENLLQNVANIVEYGMDLRTSVTQPRFGHPDPQFGVTQIEGSFPGELVAKVRKRGMSLIEVSPQNVYMGSCHAVQLDPVTREVTGVADPRRRGMAKGLGLVP